MFNRNTYKNFIIGISLIFLLWGIYVPILDVELRSQRVIVILVFSIITWILKPVPHTYSSLLTIGLLQVYVVDSFELAASGFASSLFFFFFLVILLGQSVTKVDLDRHGAYILLSKRTSGTKATRLFAGNILLLALLVPSGLARAATVMPIVNNVIESNNIDPRANWSKQMYFIAGQINPIASAAIMTGGGMSIVAAEYINASVMSLSWVEWALYMFLPTITVYILSVFVMEQIYSTNASDYDAIEVESDNQQSSELSRDQKIVLIVMISLIVSWIIGSFIGLPTLIPAIAGVFILSLPRIEILTSKEIKNANWGILFLTGTILSIINVMEETEAFEYILDIFTELLYWLAVPETGMIAIILLLVMLARILFSGGAAALVVLLPFIIQIGNQVELNTLYLSFSAVLLVASTSFLPFSTSAILLVYGQSSLNATDILKFSIITATAAVVTIGISWTIYWPLVDQLL